MTDYRAEYNGTGYDGKHNSDRVVVALNWSEGHAPDQNQVFLNVMADGEDAYILLSAEDAVSLSDRLALLAEKSVQPAEQSEAVETEKDSPMLTEGPFSQRPEFDSEGVAKAIDDVWETLVSTYGFKEGTADKFVVALLKSGAIKG